MNQDNICLFCGKPMKRKWEEYTLYHECDCPDATFNREIKAEIEKLKDQLRKPRFEIVTEAKIKRKRR